MASNPAAGFRLWQSKDRGNGGSVENVAGVSRAGLPALRFEYLPNCGGCIEVLGEVVVFGDESVLALSKVVDEVAKDHGGNPWG